MRVLGLIPARGGSKGVPRKNVRPLLGRPLLAYTAEAALGAALLDRVVLTTDDEEIATVGRQLGLDVPFIRPPHLASDTAPMIATVQHAVANLRASDDLYDAVCLLQPTTPARSSAVIDECVEHLDRSGADAVVTLLPVPSEHNPHWVYVRTPSGALTLATGESTPIARRQDLPPAFHREGSVYVTRTAVVEEGSLYGERVEGVVLDPASSVNIDTVEDWDRAERLLASLSTDR